MVQRFRFGDIGPEASKPVMEGKGFVSKFCRHDVFDIEITKKIREVCTDR
jgi:malic enzyme